MIAATQSRVSPREITAYHEAGHAVCAVVVGGQCISATIIEDGISFGSTDWIPPDDPARQMAVSLVGALAGWERDRRRGAAYQAGSGQDLAAAAACLPHITRPEDITKTPEYRTAMLLARGTVANYWGAIDHVGRWLLAHDTIRGALVHEIVQQHERIPTR